VSRLDTLKKAKTLGGLARMLHFQPSAVSFILYRIPNHAKYIQFDIPKRNGEARHIKAPEPRLKELQKRLADLLNSCFNEIHKNHKKSLSHGFRKHHSIVTNAKNHRNRRYVFNIDLEDFFPSIHFGRVRGGSKGVKGSVLASQYPCCVTPSDA